MGNILACLSQVQTLLNFSKILLTKNIINNIFVLSFLKHNIKNNNKFAEFKSKVKTIFIITLFKDFIFIFMQNTYYFLFINKINS